MYNDLTDWETEEIEAASPPHSKQVAGLKWVQALPSLCSSALNHSAILELLWGYKVLNGSCSLFRHQSLVAAGFGAVRAHSWVFAWLGTRSVPCLLFSQWVIWFEEPYFGQDFPQWLGSLGPAFFPLVVCIIPYAFLPGAGSSYCSGHPSHQFHSCLDALPCESGLSLLPVSPWSMLSHHTPASQTWSTATERDWSVLFHSSRYVGSKLFHHVRLTRQWLSAVWRIF